MNKLGILIASSLLLLASCSREVPEVDITAKQRPDPWSKELVAAARAIPLQHEGRVKPFDTLASFTLYSIHGRRDLKFCWGDQQTEVTTLTPTEWLLDVFFFPDQAARYPLFRIDNAEVFRALWPKEEHFQKLDLEYVSYQRLVPVANTLFDTVQKLEEKKDVKSMDPGEQALVALRDRLWSYHRLQQKFALLHSPYLIKGDKLLAQFEGHEHAGLYEVMTKARSIAALALEVRSLPPEQAGTAEAISQELSGLAHDSMGGPAFFPPIEGKDKVEKWTSLGDLAQLALAGQMPERQASLLRQLDIAATAPNLAARESAIMAFQGQSVAMAQSRGEYDKVDLEAKYYAWSLAYSALHWFLPGFIIVAFSWLFVRQRWIAWAGFGFTLVGLGYLVADITLRCIITSRPPIKNLYDTFLFIAAVSVAVALIAELITRRRIALAAAPILGLSLIMLARTFETMDGSDTMRQLQAVLNSNYWLATHVTIINAGYAAGMLAMALANIWLLLRAFRIWDNNPSYQKSVVRMTYGVTCFGLLFAVVGTILGGVWANDSWGRFWGWDPKENGALLICLAQTALLHARMSGWVRDFGFCLGAAATGIVVAFSWFHVNLLGVGLHAYGFSSGLKRGLFTFYGIEGGIMLAGIIGQLMRLAIPAAKPSAEPVPPALPARSH